MSNRVEIGKQPDLYRQMGFYEKYVKRGLDILCALAALLVLSWLYLLLALLVRVKLGKPICFRQQRPGLIDPEKGHEKVFSLYKFRTMTNETDENGNLLPDEQRLTRFGKLLRRTSMDELPEAFNILKGDMSVIGPRPQLVRDMFFMTPQQRMRHTARPGLSGLAQVMGRNGISWEKKLEWDLKYIKHVSFLNDVGILLKTVKNVFGGGESAQNVDITLDLGDALLQEGKVTREEYERHMAEAHELLRKEHE